MADCALSGRLKSLVGLAAVIAVFGWLLGFAYPLLTVAVRAMRLLHSGSEGSSLVQAFFAESTLAVVRATSQQAAISTAVSISLGLPLGWLVGGALARNETWGKRSIPLLAIPFGVPTLVVAFTGITFLGKHGFLARWGIDSGLAYSFSGVIVLHALLNIPWIALWVAQARQGMPSNWDEAASTLGASPRQRWLRISWPWIRPSLLVASLQVFQLCSMSYALVLIFGGGPPVETLETAMVSALKSGEVDWSKALALGIWQIGLTLIPWAWLAWREARSQLEGRRAEARGNLASIKSSTSFAARMGFILAAALLVPYVFFLFDIPRGSFFGVLETSEFKSALFNSLKIALGASALALIWTLSSVLVLGILARRSPRLAGVLRVFALLPSGISILISGLGFWFAYSAWIDPFEGSLVAMMALQAVSISPWVFRTLWPLVQTIPHRELEAARTLGARSDGAFLRIEGPRWKLPVLTAAAISFSAAIGEVAAYSLFGAEGKAPLTLLVTRWMAHYRFEDAQAVTAWILVFASGGLAWVLVRGQSSTRTGAHQ